MAIAPRMELRQGQGLVMTPQLQQAIKLLQMSTLELAVYVEQELERNPVLERLEDGDDFGIADTPDVDPREAVEASDGPQVSVDGARNGRVGHGARRGHAAGVLCRRPRNVSPLAPQH